jgi:hypothetical protein
MAISTAKKQRRPSTTEEEQSEFILKFDGRPNAISASTFLESLSGITSVLQEANRQLGNGDQLDIKIKAPEPGSFLVHLIIDPATTAQVANLFAIGGGALGALVSSIKIWKFLRGKQPKRIEPTEGNKVTIENDLGKVIIEDQKIANFVINNSTVTFNLSRTFGALDGDANVTGLELLDRDQKKKLVTVPRDDFPSLAVAPPPTQDEKRDITVRTRVTIIKPSFDAKLRWEIVYSGNRIGATVSDPVFNATVDHGAAFRKGDALDVSLRIRQEYDSALKAFLNKSYDIATVHAHIPGATQTDLFLAK